MSYSRTQKSDERRCLARDVWQDRFANSHDVVLLNGAKDLDLASCLGCCCWTLSDCMRLPTIIAWLILIQSATAKQEVQKDSLLNDAWLNGVAHSHSVVVAVDVCSDLVLVDRRQQLHPKETIRRCAQSVVSRDSI